MKNLHSPYAVIVMKGNMIVGQCTEEDFCCLLTVSWEEDTTITCTLTGRQCYSSDLPQGALEVLCILIFLGRVEYVSKIVKLLCPTGTSGSDLFPPPCKKSKINTSDDNTVLPRLSGPQISGTSVIQICTCIT